MLRIIKNKIQSIVDRNPPKSISKIFEEVYQENIWGGNKGEFSSGGGSYPQNTQLYCEFVENFISTNNIKSVIDLGCGDFRVGRQINWGNIDYYGIDVVPNLVNFNNQKFGSENIKFLCKNAAKDELPKADLCLIRQVLQHLSNHDIKIILEKVGKYQYILITDGQPSQSHDRVNVDKPTNHLTRNDLYRSGLYLENSPFDLNLEVVLDYHSSNSDERFRTVLLRTKK